jgi:hypothetical protein
MGMVIDKGFTHKIAEEVLKDYPKNESAKEILSKPKYRVNDRYFDTEEEMNEYLNDDVCADFYDGDDYSESLCDSDE